MPYLDIYLCKFFSQCFVILADERESKEISARVDQITIKVLLLLKWSKTWLLEREFVFSIFNMLYVLNSTPKSEIYYFNWKKCPYSKLFWSVFFRIWTRITPNTNTFYAVQMRNNSTSNSSRLKSSSVRECICYLHVIFVVAVVVLLKRRFFSVLQINAVLTLS